MSSSEDAAATAADEEEPFVLFTIFDYTFTPWALVVLLVLVGVCISFLVFAAIATKRLFVANTKTKKHPTPQANHRSAGGGGILLCLAGPLIVCGFIGVAVAMVFMIGQTVVVLC